jgi:chromosome segregation ATPase
MSSSSPKYSFTREITPPSSSSDPSLRNIHDRLSQIDSRIHDLRATVLTKDSYVDRRNREDDSIRREFDTHHQISERIEGHVGRVQVDVNQLKTDIDYLKTEIGQLKSNICELGSGSGLLHDHVDRLQNNVCQLQVDMNQLQTDVRGVRTDISQIQSITSQLRTDFMTWQRDTSRHFGEVFSRFSSMESRMKHMERIRFNSLAHTIHAPITRVPYIDDDGTVRWPEYFPQTVWKFWCLKKRSRGEIIFVV